MLKRNWNCLKLFWPAGEWDWSPSGNLWYFKLWGNFGNESKIGIRKKKFHGSMARIYPVLISYYFLMVGLVKTNSIQLSLTRFCEINTKSYEWIYLLYITCIEFRKKADKQRKKNQTYQSSVFLTLAGTNSGTET